MNKTDSESASIKIVRLSNNASEELIDQVVIEEPLEIRLAYVDPIKGPLHKSISITMRTPGDDKALVTGFLFSESIIKKSSELKNIETTKDNVIRVELHDDVKFDISRLERHFYTTSSCGVCGKASLETLSLSGMEAIHDNSFSISPQALSQLTDKLSAHQDLFSQTGGNHATATFDSSGLIHDVTEDVGRHNAMDKLIGRLLHKGELPLHNHGIIVSGRASFELMQKALAAGCPMLVAVGAPSSLAVELAQEFNITLLGFLNDRGFNIYHGKENISY